MDTHPISNPDLWTAEQSEWEILQPEGPGKSSSVLRAGLLQGAPLGHSLGHGLDPKY